LSNPSGDSSRAKAEGSTIRASVDTSPPMFIRPHCDPKAAIHRLAGAVDLYRELLMTFFDGAAESIQRLRSAAEREDAEEVHRAAHQLRGVAATCGATGVVSLTEKLEHMGRARDLTGSIELCDDLVGEMQQSRDELSPYLAPPSA
jgi:two-component system, sensor histidine kinase and response regulator